MLLVMCRILVALSHQGETQTEIMSVEGKLLSEASETFTVDFSEDIKRLPIEGSPKNYSKMVVDKDDCTNPYK